MSRFPFMVPERLSEKLSEKLSSKLWFEGLRAELTELLERWWHCGLSTGPLDGMDWAPPVELRDEPGQYRVLVELPGVERSKIEVLARPTSLTVSGEKAEPLLAAATEHEEAATPRVLRSQRRYGRFRRIVDLPGPVQTEAISASLADGVLEVTLPKAAGADATEIAIEVRSG